MKLEVDRWTVQDLTLTPDKVNALWRVIRRHQTLFSDLTRNDAGNFLRAVTASHTLWFEVREKGILTGIIWFGDLHLMTEVSGHMAFFDRRAQEKVVVCREVIKWMFKNFPIHRINVTPPDIYVATIRLMRKLGLVEEGVKREAVLLGGKWRNQILFGITRAEADAL